MAASVAKTDQKKQKDILRIEWRKETEVIAKLNAKVFFDHKKYHSDLMNDQVEKT